MSGRCPRAREPRDEVGFDVQDVRRGQGANVFGDARAVHQRDAVADGSGGQVLGQFAPHGRVGDHVTAGDELLDFAADVGGVPRRAARSEPRQHLLDGVLAVERTDRARVERHWCGGVAVTQLVQFGDPAAGQFGPSRGTILSGGRRPRPAHPTPPQSPRRARDPDSQRATASS